MDHFQWNTEHHLHQNVCADVDEPVGDTLFMSMSKNQLKYLPSVNQHVREEAPSFLPTGRIVDKRRLERNGSVWSNATHFDGIIDEYTYLIAKSVNI